MIRPRGARRRRSAEEPRGAEDHAARHRASLDVGHWGVTVGSDLETRRDSDGKIRLVGTCEDRRLTRPSDCVQQYCGRVGAGIGYGQIRFAVPVSITHFVLDSDRADIYQGRRLGWRRTARLGSRYHQQQFNFHDAQSRQWIFRPASRIRCRCTSRHRISRS